MRAEMSVVYLSLGTNLGEKEVNLRQAIQLINERIGKVISLSAFYQTEPWGFSSENTFLNAAAGVETTMTPLEILAATQAIERQMGRLQKSGTNGYADRIIDIDLLLYNDLILDLPELKLPHPLMTERDFVMTPLLEIAPNVVHPLFNKPLKDLMK